MIKDVIIHDKEPAWRSKIPSSQLHRLHSL